VVSFTGTCGGGEGKAVVSRTAAAKALPSPSPPTRRTLLAAPAAPQGQGEDYEQPNADRALATTTTTASSRRGRSRAAVVSSRELMERSLAFVAGGRREAREEVGRAAVVCRVWREAAYGAEVWGRVASEVMPVVGGGGGGRGRDGRGYVAEVGRCLLERRVRWGDDWWQGLRLHLEVWDDRDGLRMLSAEGRLGVSVSGNGFTNLGVTGSDRLEVVGPAFSAASRDPEHHRLDDINKYVLRAHEEGMPAVLCARAVVRDVRSGRRALLWESGKLYQWGALEVPANSVYAPFLPQGSLCIGTRGGGLRAVVSPACGTGEEAVMMGFNFYVRPEAGQEEMPAPEKLWRLAGADVERYGEHNSFASIFFRAGDRDLVGKRVWSLLHTC
jgi:hypothetical protein